MKKLCLFLVGCWLIALPAYSQLFMRLAYQKSAPMGDMRRNIGSNAHGGGAEAGFVIPKTGFTVGWHWSVLSYATKRYEDLRVFSQGAQSKVLGGVTNYFTQSHLFVNYDIPTKGKWQPYLSTGIGTSRFQTIMTMEAETSTTECPKPLETRIPLRDRVLHYVMGGGIKFDYSEAVGVKDGSRFYIDFHFQHVRGGTTEYLNVREANIPPQNATPLNVKFASQERPEVVYDYYAGNKYSSPVRLLTFQIGFTYIGKLSFR